MPTPLATATLEPSPAAPRRRLDRAARVLEWPVIVLALLVVPVILLENRAESPALQTAAMVANWVIWIVFCVDFGVRWALARRLSFLRDAWLHALLIVVSPPFVPEYLQGARSLRALQILRLVRSFAVAAMGLTLVQRMFGRRRFQYVAVLAVALVFFARSPSTASSTA